VTGSADNPTSLAAVDSDPAEILWHACFDALVLVDDDRRYTRVNAPATALLGAPANRVIGARLDDFTPGDRRPLLERLWHDLQDRGALHGPYELLRGDGQRGLVELRARRDFTPGEHLIVGRAIPGGGSVRSAGSAGRGRLTAREQQILQLAADGGSTRGIAETLVISPGTVKIHFEHVYEKFGVSDRAAAVAEGLRQGMIR
jgi:DNA-binding CsgD family transcriptional regulator